MLSALEISNPKLPDKMVLETFTNRERPELLKAIEALRVKVWQAFLFPLKPGHENDTHWGDHWDANCTHFAIVKDEVVIAATRVTEHNSIAESPYPEWFQGISTFPNVSVLYISRLVVDPDFQRQGLSDFLDLKCVALGRHLHAGAIICDVPEYRIKALLKRGFALTSDEKLGILFPTIRFSGMILRLDR